MTGGRASLIWLVLLGVGVGLFAGMWLLPHLHRVYEQTETLNRLEIEGQQLAARVQELADELKQMLAGPAEESPKPNPGLTRAQALAREEAAKRVADVRMLAETQEKLEAAELTIDELNAEVQSLEASVNRLREQSGMLAESEHDLQEQLERSKRIVKALQDELKGNSDRLVKLEVRNRKLRQDNKDAKTETARAKKLVQDLENLNRRREDVITNIIRRYGEVADEYRTIALRVNNPAQYGPTEGVDLSRIQNALTLADEDLRTLRSLNNRAARIRKELTQ